MKALLLRSLLIAVLVGPAIDLIRTVALFHSGTRYDPPLSEAEFHQMGNMTINDMEAPSPKGELR